jgi:hypothetical protein
VNTAIANETSDTVVSASAGVWCFGLSGSFAARSSGRRPGALQGEGVRAGKVAEYWELTPSAATRDGVEPFLSKLPRGASSAKADVVYGAARKGG